MSLIARRPSISAAVAALVTASLALASPPVDAQQGAAPTIPAATQLMQQGDLEGAAGMLTRLTAEQPDNANAWGLLGVVHRRSGAYGEAAAAVQRAIELQPQTPRFTFSLGLVRAFEGDLDSAFELLLAAKAAGFNSTVVGLDPADALLRDDPRYRSIFPSQDEYGAPFVEPASIIHDWAGEAAGDQFGWIARNIGDVDGDGVNDVTTSAPTKSIDGAQNAGRVYVYSGRSGALLWTADGAAGNQLGIGIEAAGDVSGDGVPDVIAGAPGADRAYVYDGRTGAIVLELVGESGEFFGREVMDLGDVNKDGHADVIVGAPLSNEAAQGAGRAYVISGADGSRLLTLDGPSAGAAFGSAAGGYVSDDLVMIVIGAPGAGESGGGLAFVYVGETLTDEHSFVIGEDDQTAALGNMFVSIVGDVDADGHPDAYASDFTGAATVGQIFVYSGRTGEPIHVLSGESAGDGFGIGPADAGDVDGDGHDDLVVGAWQYSASAPSGGKVYVYSGKDATLVRTITGRVMGETLGFDATGLGDVDGDGSIDFLLTSAWSGISGTQSGRTLVISGGG